MAVVLVVDDDPLILRSFEFLLPREHEIIKSRNSSEAIKLFAARALMS